MTHSSCLIFLAIRTFARVFESMYFFHNGKIEQYRITTITRKCNQIKLDTNTLICISCFFGLVFAGCWRSISGNQPQPSSLCLFKTITVFIFCFVPVRRKAKPSSYKAAENVFLAPLPQYMYPFHRTTALCMESWALQYLCKRECESIAVVANTQRQKWNAVKVRIHSGSVIQPGLGGRAFTRLPCWLQKLHKFLGGIYL